MKRLIDRVKRAWLEDEGVLSFEWVLLLTLLVIGIVGGLAAARDAIIDELGDVTEATINIDQSYEITGDATLGIPTSSFKDKLPKFSDGARTPALADQQTGTSDGT